jgi:hypothetical protein
MRTYCTGPRLGTKDITIDVKVTMFQKAYSISGIWSRRPGQTGTAHPHTGYQYAGAPERRDQAPHSCRAHLPQLRELPAAGARPRGRNPGELARAALTTYENTRKRCCAVPPDDRPVQPSTVLARSRALRAGFAGAAAVAATSLTAAARGALPEGRSERKDGPADRAKGCCS